MPRGQPDYGLYTQTPVASGISDPGEAAARLGSINIFDRRGWTVWMDDFEAPSLKWATSRTAPGELAVLSTATAFSGVQSVFLNGPAGVGTISSLVRRFPLLRQGKIGMEFWCQGFTKTPGYLQVAMNIYDGVSPHYFELRYDTDAGIISIATPAGIIPIVTEVYMWVAEFYFLPIKIVVDMDTDMYVRLLVSDREFDISMHALLALGFNTWRQVNPYFNVVGGIRDDMWMYIDNFILTQNEP